jgi:glutamate:GABA antiporter
LTDSHAAPPAGPRLKLLDTTLYAIVATIGIRWLPVAAVAGVASLPLWLLAFLTFYIPLAIATAELTSRFHGGGSLYGWVRGTFGPLSGFVCGWFYWVALLPYFAGIIYFLSGLVLSAVGANTHNATLYLAVSLAIACIATAVQFFGLRLGKWLTNLGGSGSWLIFFLIIAAAAMLVWRGGSATKFLGSSWVPTFGFDTAILWGTIVFALGGAESVAFLRNDIEGGIRTVVRALVALGIAMVLIYMVGTAAMLVILPKAELTRLSGLPDALHAAFSRVGFPALAGLAIGLFAVSQLGGLTAWFGIAVRLPVEAGIDSFLPPLFARRNPKTGAPGPAILLQGGLTIVMVILSQAGEGAAAAYDFLIAMSVLTSTIPYVLVFAAYVSRKRWPDSADAWLPPGGARTGLVLGAVGMIASLVAIGCTLVPSGTDPHPWTSLFKIVISTVAMLVVGLFLYWSGARNRVAVRPGQAVP